jgi:hypothetical protein
MPLRAANVKPLGLVFTLMNYHLGLARIYFMYFYVYDGVRQQTDSRDGC